MSDVMSFQEFVSSVGFFLSIVKMSSWELVKFSES